MISCNPLLCYGFSSRLRVKGGVEAFEGDEAGIRDVPIGELAQPGVADLCPSGNGLPIALAGLQLGQHKLV